MVTMLKCWFENVSSALRLPSSIMSTFRVMTDCGVPMEAPWARSSLATIQLRGLGLEFLERGAELLVYGAGEIASIRSDQNVPSKISDLHVRGWALAGDRLAVTTGYEVFLESAAGSMEEVVPGFYANEIHATSDFLFFPTESFETGLELGSYDLRNRRGSRSRLVPW